LAAFGTLMTFDKLIQEVTARYHLGPKGRVIVEEALDLIVRHGGLGGFLGKVRDAGFGAEVASWSAGSAPVPLSGRQIQQALGPDAIKGIAHKAGVSQGFARTVLGYTIPKIISLLAQAGQLTVALPPASATADRPAQYREEQIMPSRVQAGRLAPWLKEMVIPAAALLIIFGAVGYLISIGWTGHRSVSQPSAIVAENAPAAVPSTPSIPPRFALTNSNGAVVYSGTVRDDAARSAILNSLATVFAGNKISGRLAVDPHVGPAVWIPDLKKVLPNFKAPGSEVRFEGGSVSVGGAIPDADRKRIIGSLKSTLGPQFTVATLAGSGTASKAVASSLVSQVSNSSQAPLNLPTIYFAGHSDVISSDSKASLERAAVSIKQLPAGTVVHISGYAKNGKPSANLKLSRRRANAVRRILLGEGVDPAILKAEGHGALPPRAGANGTTEGRSEMKGREGWDLGVEFSITQRKG